ncbi:hypothetical protein [Pararhizobium sp. PWRC1-1]|uniref:hypothetical protein n=1 Tax=Pararhizobium sp. PWRC1-1 TaxID=2804566 RepID=UPI003CF5B2AB
MKAGDEIRLPTGVAFQLDELLATIDESPSQVLMPRRPSMSNTQRQRIAAKLVDIKQDLKDNQGPYYDALRIQARKDYANERAAEGRSVRPYQKHPLIVGETELERDKRLHREGSRRRVGKDASTTRGYLDRSEMTEAEKSSRKRQQDAESKRRRRAEKAASQGAELKSRAAQ